MSSRRRTCSIGLLGYGIVATAFAALAITLVLRRESGVLKRVRGTPLGPATYLAAVIVSTLVVLALEVVAQLLVGVYVLGHRLARGPPLRGLAILLGAVVFAALGLAVTRSSAAPRAPRPS